MSANVIAKNKFQGPYKTRYLQGRELHRELLTHLRFPESSKVYPRHCAATTQRVGRPSSMQRSHPAIQALFPILSVTHMYHSETFVSFLSLKSS
jgi:hypothetical protein